MLWISGAKRLSNIETGPETKRCGERTNHGKPLLRKVRRRYVGAEAIGHENQGFQAPDTP